MNRIKERPGTRQDRLVGLVALAVITGCCTWLIWRILANVDFNHSWEILTLAVLLGTGTYLGWLLILLASVHYELADNELVLSQTWSQVVIPLNRMLHLYRWRHRWTWSGTMQSDLGIEEMDLFPPAWVAPKSALWVIVYEAATGERRAVSIRPSASLLAFLKAWVWERKGTAE